MILDPSYDVEKIDSTVAFDYRTFNYSKIITQSKKLRYI